MDMKTPFLVSKAKSVLKCLHDQIKVENDCDDEYECVT